MSAVWFLAGLWVGATVGVITMALLAAHGERERRHRMEVGKA